MRCRRRREFREILDYMETGVLVETVAMETDSVVGDTQDRTDRRAETGSHKPPLRLLVKRPPSCSLESTNDPPPTLQVSRATRRETLVSLMAIRVHGPEPNLGRLRSPH